MEKMYQLKVSEEELRALLTWHTLKMGTAIAHDLEGSDAETIDARSQRIRDLSKRLAKADKPETEQSGFTQTSNDVPGDPQTVPAPVAKSGW